jgi:hypothetical protein
MRSSDESMPLPQRHRGRPELLLVAALACAACGESVVRVTPLSADLDGLTDGTVDPADSADPGDPPDDPADGDGALPGVGDECGTICWYLVECASYVLPSVDCGSLCARLKPEVLSCLVSASEATCAEADDCFVPSSIPAACGPLCAFVTGNCGWLCDLYCPLYSDVVLECATGAVPSPGCPGIEDCMISTSFGTTCDQACDFAVSGCGLDIGLEECVGFCSGLGPYSASFACMDTSTFLGDCSAMYHCF